ncbi:MAG: M1 family metallopeptidase, partial [Chitinophagaceae bacterium]|nr:M1 family metallopeptidase [Chitinophagaceae bacterium]
MKNTLLLLLSLIGNYCFAQKSYWQQETNFTITVSLNDATHTLDGFETIEYTNHSPDTLSFIWFHLWPNAYKNDRTDFSEQLLANGRTDFYFSKAADKGYINRLDFTADNLKASLEYTPQLDVVKVVLPKPLAPKHTTNISTPFHVQLPYNFSRGGHIGNDYQVTQWFPKPAVYDAKGWHPMPYVDQGEFYSEFGSYDVQITLPPAYTVAATGRLQNPEEVELIKKTGKPVAANTNRTWHYQQNAIHDFAWFASKNLVAHYDTTILPGGKKVDIFSYYKPASEAWKKSLQYAKDGLQYYSSRLGDYPYDVVRIVEGAENVSSGGMEYPTITLITTNETGRQLDATIVHEIGHNWFYGALASNERLHAWMDEGMNTFYQKEYETQKYGTSNTLQTNAKGFSNKLPADEEKLLLQTMIQLAKDEPIDKPAKGYSEVNYGLSVYVKGAVWMQQLETNLGKTLFDSSMKAYYRQYQFKHPYPEDFRKSVEGTANRDLTENFSKLYTTGALTKPVQRTVKPSFLFNLKETDKYQYINVAPAFGYNRYDKIMAGLLVHNYQLPLNKFNFFAGGLYGSGSKKLNGFGRASYTARKKYKDIETAISLFNFSKNDFSTGQNKVLFPRIRRIVPSVKITLYDKDPSYKRSWTFAWKTFLLKEDELKFTTVITPTDTIERVSLQSGNTTINRLAITYADNRVLYPYTVNLSADQGKDFVRAGLTANYF